ncbi:dipeptidase PepE [Polaromonas sp. P1-6]|nr:dipeptidase PepE [Polaromonas sp. P1-6]
MAPTGIKVTGAHRITDIAKALVENDLILVGGGNTFNLLREVRSRGWLPDLRAEVLGGKPYVGWSAGSNLACPTLRTTNDMPIVDPMGFDGLGLIPFQLNAHFTNELPSGLQAETREQRIAEFLTLNPNMGVLGLPEGVWLRVQHGFATIGGNQAAIWFSSGNPTQKLEVGFEWSLLSGLFT